MIFHHLSFHWQYTPTPPDHPIVTPSHLTLGLLSSGHFPHLSLMMVPLTQAVEGDFQRMWSGWELWKSFISQTKRGSWILQDADLYSQMFFFPGHRCVLPFNCFKFVINSILLPYFLEFSDEFPQLKFEQVPFNHPLFIMYSSGTTGPPKCMVHSVGVSEKNSVSTPLTWLVS